MKTVKMISDVPQQLTLTWAGGGVDVVRVEGEARPYLFLWDEAGDTLDFLPLELARDRYPVEAEAVRAAFSPTLIAALVGATVLTPGFALAPVLGTR